MRPLGRRVEWFQEMEPIECAKAGQLHVQRIKLIMSGAFVTFKIYSRGSEQSPLHLIRCNGKGDG